MFYCDLQIELDAVYMYGVYFKLNTLLSFYHHELLVSTMSGFVFLYTGLYHLLIART